MTDGYTLKKLTDVKDSAPELGPLDALRVAPNVTRCFEAGPEGLELIAFGPHHQGDGEIIQGWWDD